MSVWLRGKEQADLDVPCTNKVFTTHGHEAASPEVQQAFIPDSVKLAEVQGQLDKLLTKVHVLTEERDEAESHVKDLEFQVREAHKDLVREVARNNTYQHQLRVLFTVLDRLVQDREG